MIVGDEISQYFVVIGRAVDEVRLAEGLAVASTIILSPNAWELCERDNIAIDPIENERAVKVCVCLWMDGYVYDECSFKQAGGF